MKTAICYFSGTGNTKRTADAWLRALSGEGMSSEAFRIDYGRMPDLRSFDRIGIFYPIHAFNAPEIVLKFAENLPVFPQEKVFFVVMVSGEPLRLNHSSDQAYGRAGFSDGSDHAGAGAASCAGIYHGRKMP